MDGMIDVFPVETENLSAAEFLKLYKDNPSMIKSSTVVHPKAGVSGFGTFQVVYSRPLYKALPRIKARTSK